MEYTIKQNPEYISPGKKVKPLHVYLIGRGIKPRRLKRNLAGAVNIIRQNHADVTIIDESSFTDSELLNRLKAHLDKKSIAYKVT